MPPETSPRHSSAPASSGEARRRAILVLGMHRSGTSALARVLAMRGATLPANVMPANYGNPSGYWEPEGIVALNDRMLAHYGADWCDPFATSRLPDAQDMPTHFREEAAALLAEEFGDADLFVLKDPRCTLFADFWAQVLAESGVECCPVVMMRPYLEVADSLRRRDGADMAATVMLYLAYAIECVKFGQRHQTSYLTYAQLLADWQGTTERIASEQGFSWPDSGRGSAEEIEAFLVPSTREVPPVALPDDLQRWAERLWEWLAARAEEDRSAGDVGDVVRERHLASTLFLPAFAERTRRMARLTRKVDELHATEQKLHQQFLESQSTLEHAVLDRDTARAERDQLLQFREEFIKQREEDTRRHEEDVRRHEEDVRRHEEDVRRHEEDVRRHEEDVRRHEDDVRRHEEDIRRHQQDIRKHEEIARQRDELTHQLNTILSSRSWWLTKPLRFGGRLVRATVRRALRLLRIDRGHPVVKRLVSTPKGLKGFLAQEFGAAVADDVAARIEAFQLPVDNSEIRTAARTSCSEAEASDWMARLAQAAPDSGLDPDAPEVSIVVPVYNQVRFTLACLDSLLAHRTRYRFEVLVGDDGSTDATQAAFATPIPGVHHIRHKKNLGFVRNCNATAAHAKGRHVVFLNNDTLVLPNWLDELIGVLERDSSVGLSGSKLIYPDGRLQECGAIVWKDGSAWNLGRFDDPRKPEYCYLRDVDYVSGASIALPTGLWRQLGGFDELFVPAYAEDADLAFRVRAAGLRTVVQPLSQLLHFEGVTSGTDTGQGAKAHQVENLVKLKERWADVIEHHRDNADSPQLEKERSVRRRVLFVDRCTPTPNADAGSLVAWEIMSAFQQLGFKVTFIPEDNFAHMGADTADLQRTGIETIYHPACSSMREFLSQRNDPFDVIFLHRYQVGAAHMRELRKHFPRARILFLNADMHFLRELREAELSGDAAALVAAQATREQELAVATAADCTLVHSQAELEILQTQCPAAHSVLFPLIHDPVDGPVSLEGRDGVCFVGGYRHPPNADGIVWFVENAWPQVVAAYPDAVLRVVGSHATPAVQALAQHPNVEVLGFVDDLEDFLARQRVSVAPLRYGAGAKGKVAASLANGVPAVCTPIAMEGMGLADGENVLVGETAAELADRVIELLGDDGRWHALAAAGLAYADEVTSRRHASRRIEAILNQLDPVPSQ